MAASRDLTTGARGGTATALLEREHTDAPVRESRRTAAPTGLKPTVAPHVPRRRSRLGSKQVVSVRGRRVAATTEAKRKFSALTFVALPLLILGIFGAMLLSALSTQQTFTIEQLKAEDRLLSNQLESLNRTVEEARSVSDLALRADSAGMVVPGQPGMIAVDADGKANEVGEADAEKKYRVIDVNAETIRVDRATSDKDATRDVADNLSALPNNGEIPFAATPGPSGRGAAAPAPREVAPAPQPAAPQPEQHPAPRAETPRAPTGELPIAPR